MWATLNFSNFDPLDGEIDYSEFCWGDETGRVIFRARAVLENVSKEDIDEAISLIDWMVSQVESTDNQLERRQREIANRDEITEIFMERMKRFCCSVIQIKELEDEYDLCSLQGNQTWKWSQLYALYTLNIIGDAVERAIIINRDYKGATYFGRSLANYVSYYLFEAYEMLAIAERKCVEENITDYVEKQTRSKISMRNQSAAIQRHAPVRKLKDEFITWYRENEREGFFKSKTQAATKFFDNCSEEKRKLLAPTNAVRTLLDALKDYERTRISST